MKTILRLICSFIILCVFSNTLVTADAAITPDSIKIILSKNAMEVGETQTVKVSVLPANAENYELEYYSDNPDVVIAAIGTLIAVTEGTAEVTVRIKDTEIFDKVNVTVGNIQEVEPPIEIILKQSYYQLQRYDEVKINYEILPVHAEKQTVIFTSLNTTIAAVDKAGLIYGKNAGKTKIMLQTEDKSITEYVEVIVKEDSYSNDYAYGNIAVRRVDIYDGDDEVIKTIEIMRTQSKQFRVQIYPLNASDKHVRWRSSDNNIAKVDENGIVTGLSEGAVKIYATARDNGRQDVITVKVIPYVRYPDSISIVPPENALFETGQTIKFNAIFLPDDTTIKDLKWMIIGGCATIDHNGAVTITDKGTATVKAYTTDWKLSAEYTFESEFSTNHFKLIGECHNIKSNRPVIVNFDEEVNINSAEYNIFVAIDELGNTTPVKISLTVTGRQVIVVPMEGWVIEGCYIFIQGNICDIYGNRLGENLKYKISNVRG